MASKEYIDWNVIARRILGKATGEENARVEAWLAESEANEAYYRKARRYFEVYYTGLGSREVDVESAWGEFLAYTCRSERRLRMRRLARLAAAVALPLLVAVAVLWPEGRDGAERVEVARSLPIEPGTLKAVLRVSSGEEVALSDTVDVVRMVERLSGERAEAEERGDSARGRAERFSTVIVPKGGEFTLTLADGTRVVMNSDSRMRFPERFEGDTRRVFLAGEAFFEVARDSARPFVVGVRGSHVRVLGTSFNVKGYADDSYVQTTLVEGRVAFRAEGRGREEELTPGEQATYDRETGELVVRKVNAAACTAWVKGGWVVEGVRLEEMMKQLSRWYNVAVFYQNPAAKELIFTGDLERYEDFDVVLRLIEMTTDVRFEVNGRTITVKYNP